MSSVFSDGPVRILPRLYIGDATCEYPSAISKSNISVVVSATTVPVLFGRNIYVARITILDKPELNIYQYFDETADYIERHRNASTDRLVMITSTQGLSRAPALMVAYLMKHKKFTYDTAYGLVKFHLPQVEQAMNFVPQLKAYETELRNRKNPGKRLMPTTHSSQDDLSSRFLGDMVGSRLLRSEPTIVVPPVFTSNDLDINSPKRSKRPGRLRSFFKRPFIGKPPLK